MDLEQLGRPILETGSAEGPTTGVRKPLCLGKIEFRLLELFDVEVNADPIEQCSIVRPQRFDAADTPAVASSSVTYSEDVLTCGAGFEAIGPMFARLVAIVRMQQRDVGVPGGAHVDPEPEGMILRQTHVISGPCIHEG